jgi:hypothetical protein
LDAGDTATGIAVQLEGIPAETPPQEISIDTFLSIPLAVVNHTVESGGRALTLNGTPIRTKLIGSGEVH